MQMGLGFAAAVGRDGHRQRGREEVRSSAGPGTSPTSEETRQPRWGHDNGGYQPRDVATADALSPA
jgi:hypothetical protein